MLKKIFLIFAFLFIAQAIAYSLPGDTVWVKNKVFVRNIKFSVTGDSIFCISYPDTNKFQIRSTATGNVLREFPFKFNSKSGYQLSANGRKIYFGMAYPMDSNYINYPIILSLDLQTGDTTVIARTIQPNDTNGLDYYLFAYSAINLSVSKDEKYLIAYFNTKFGGGTLLFDLLQKIPISLQPSKNMVNTIFSPTQNYFARCKKKIELINPDSLTKIGELDKIPAIDNYDAKYLLFSPNGNKLISYATENNKKIDIWNLNTKQIQDSIILSTQIEDINFLPDNKNIAFTCFNWTSYLHFWKIYNIETKDSIYTFPTYIKEINASSDMNYMIFSMRDSNLVLIETPQEITSVYEPPKNDNFYNIYPNPSTNTINIDYSENLYGIKMEIYNSMGIAFWMGRAESKGIDVSNLAVGVYFLRIGNETKMFVKE